jgi:hypothetical protein
VGEGGTSYTLPDGTPVTEEDPAWPQRYGVRLTRICDNELFEDVEDLTGIPVAVNTNIPLPYSPYGQGEPERLGGMQAALDMLLSSAVTYFAYASFPPELVPTSVMDRLGGALANARSIPGQRIPIGDDLIMQLGGIEKVMTQLPAGTLPADFWRLIEFLAASIDNEANQSQVMQGEAAAGWSGDAIKNLQSAATQVIRAKSQRTEAYLQHIAYTIYFQIINFMTPDDWARYCSKYPVAVLRAMAKKGDFRADVTVSIKSGTAANAAGETQNLIAAKGQGVPISDRTIQRRLNLDPDEELQNTLMDQAVLQQAAAASAPPTQDTGTNTKPPTGQVTG